MKAHDLARKLLAGPDLPVIINGWGSAEGSAFEVNDVSSEPSSFSGVDDTADTPRNSMGYIEPRECLSLLHCDDAPRSAKDIEDERLRNAMIQRDRERLTPAEFAFRYAEIRPLTPSAFAKMVESEGVWPKKGS